MRLLKKHILLRLINSYVVDSPQPVNISYRIYNIFKYLFISLILISIIYTFLSEASKHAYNTTLEKIVNEVNGNNFLPTSDFDVLAFINKLYEVFFKEIMQMLKFADVQGHLDDLIGQRMFIEVILFILCISIILLFIVFIFNLIFITYKESIINKFNNKIITLYVKYQSFIAKITLIYMPILIVTGLFTLCHGLHWLMTHQIPYESLDIDLHQYVSSSACFVLIFKLRKVKNNLNANKKILMKNPLFVIIQNK